MVNKEALRLALEALEYIYEGANKQGPHTGISWRCVSNKAEPAITALREALAEQPAQRKPVAWKLVPTEPTEEMLKAMDECSKEGYDERLYAGHAASVYMAAVDASPAQQQEPVAWATQMGEYAHIHWGAKRPEYPMVYEVPLYTSPPAQRKESK